jgi:F420-non-reducing hydrogenase iron-sulfur subunit
MKVIRVMCSARIDPAFILKALMSGIDGVLVSGCHPGDCHYIKGNYYTRRRMSALRRMLTAVGFEPGRVRLEWVSASEGGRFAEVVKEFTDTIKSLGPNPLRKQSDAESQRVS